MLQQIRDNLDMHFNNIIDTSWGNTPPPPTDVNAGGGGNNNGQTWRTAVLVPVTVAAGTAVLNTTLTLAVGDVLVAPIVGRLLH